MTYKQILKEFDEQFPAMDNYLDGGVKNDIKSFLKQSFIKYLQSEAEMLPEGASKADLFSSDPTRMFKADIREEYRNEVIARLQAQIKELETCK